MSVFGYGALTLCRRPSHAVLLTYRRITLSTTPKILLPSVWPNPRSLATTSGISVDVFSSPYLDVSVQAVPRVRLFDQRTLLEVCSSGFPHSEISGSMLICSSPKLIAACHVLLRLLMPRHSPCALSSLTFVGAKSAKLRFRRTLSRPSKTPPAPLRLLSRSQTLRWFAILYFLQAAAFVRLS